MSIMNTNKLELPNNDILNLLHLNKVQRSEMKRFFKTENERPGGPKEGSFEEIMEDILNPASYGVEEEVGSIMDNVTSVEIQDHKWKNYQGIVETCKKIVVKSECEENYYEGVHLEFLVKHDNEQFLVMRIVDPKSSPVEVLLRYDNMFDQIVDIDIDPKLEWVSVWEI